MPLEPASAPLSIFVHIGVRAECAATRQHPRHKEIELARKVSVDASGARSNLALRKAKNVVAIHGRTESERKSRPNCR